MGCEKRGEVLGSAGAGDGGDDDDMLLLSTVQYGQREDDWEKQRSTYNRGRNGTVYHRSTSTAPDPWLLNSCSACISTFFLLSSLRTSTSTDSDSTP